MAATVTVTELWLDQIRRDSGTQSRVSMDDAVVREYADAIIDGATLPPAVVFFDGTAYWLADGWHRADAYNLIGDAVMPCEVHSGTQADAKLYSYGANREHGLRRSNADKRKAVEGMLRDFTGWSDNRIAKHVGVHHSTVAQHRASLAESASEKSTERIYTTKHGTEAVMNVSGQQQAAMDRAAAIDRAAARQADPSLADSASEPTVATPREQPTSGPVTVDRPVLTGTDDNDDGPDEPDEQDHAEPSAADLMAELQSENTALAALVKAAEADDAKAEVVKWRRAYDNAVRQQSEAMERAAAAVKRETWTMTQLRRCGRAVGVDDPQKVAAAVEAAVRAAKAEA